MTEHTHPALEALLAIRDQSEPQHPTATWARDEAKAAIPALEALIADYAEASARARRWEDLMTAQAIGRMANALDPSGELGIDAVERPHKVAELVVECVAQRNRLREALEEAPQAVFDEVEPMAGGTVAMAGANAAKWVLRTAIAKAKGKP